MSKTKRDQQTGITVRVHAPDAQSVFVAGNFNEWQPDGLPMEQAEGGWWTVSLALSPGHYEYKFVVDGVWCCTCSGTETAEECPDCVSNVFGTLNRTLDVEA